MPPSQDLTILPIVRQQRIDQPELPGLAAIAPPRRAGRGRAQDRLLLHLTLQGNAPLSDKAYTKLLDSLAETYFKSTGSATAAMRVVAESLNQSLFSRNQRGSSRGMRSLGILSLAVFRGNRLYLAQCGSTHAFLVRADGAQHFTDPSAAGRGLGMGRAIPIQYHQAEVGPGDLLIISPNPPASWFQPGMIALHGKTIGQVHPRLLASASADLEAVLVQIAAGNGNLRLLRPEQSGSAPRPEPDRPPVVAAVPFETAPISEVSYTPEISEEPPFPDEETTPPQESRQFTPAPPTSAVVAAPLDEPVTTPESKKSAKTPKPPRQPIIGPALLAFGQALGTTIQQVSRTLGTLLRRMLPDEKMLDLPPSVMLFIAVAVPVVIVAVASVVYFREGRGRLHQEKLTQAEAVAEQALQLEDPLEKRLAWDQVLQNLDEAEAYGTSEGSSQLRQYAYSVIDTIDKVDRLDFQPGIVRGLPEGVTIKKIVVSVENELYLLNSQAGNVLRATYSDQGYVLDPVFNCGPIPAPLMVGPLIDIAVLPLGEPDGATVLGLDANGVLMRCVPGETNGPNVMPMAPPDINWGEPRAFSLDNGNIYVLDPKTNSVWVYWGIDEYKELPTYYFGNQVPSLQSVVDMMVSDGDLYLLHDNGQITFCIYSSYVDSPTRCEDPAEYADLRDGYSNGPVMQGTHFNEIQYAPQPDPSFYLFDPLDEAIYHMSLRLAFQRQYRPLYPLPGDPTTFAVGPNRRAFIATADQVYYAIMP